VAEAEGTQPFAVGTLHTSPQAPRQSKSGVFVLAKETVCVPVKHEAGAVNVVVSGPRLVTSKFSQAVAVGILMAARRMLEAQD
jgi:hypothetical protein